VAHAILDELSAAGADIIFGIPGGAIGPLFDAVLDRPAYRTIIVKHETQAVFMAMGYARATGRPALVATTAGPGITNALTGLASAALDALPLIMVAGEVATTTFGRGTVQDGSAHSIDTVSIARKMSKFAAQVAIPATAPSIARRAVATARSGKMGPAFISLPIDIACAKIERTRLNGAVQSRFEVSPEVCRMAAQALGRARHPLMLVGNGARSPQARQAVRHLAEKLSLPVIATTKGKGIIPEDHPLFLGIFGLGGQASVVAQLEKCPPDVLLVCGSSLNDIGTNAWSPLLAPTDVQIHVDLDTLQIGRNYRTDIGIVGPLEYVLPRLIELVGSRPADPERTPLRDHPEPVARGRPGTLSAQQTVAVLNEVLGERTVFTCDFGEYLSTAIGRLKIREGGDFLLSLGLGSMGSSIGTAIGHALGAPEKRVVALCGDGTMLMYGNEVSTAARYRIPVTFCVVNDGRLNMCHHGQTAIYGRTLSLDHGAVDVAMLATALGAKGVRVTCEAELARALVQPADGPVVIDIASDPDVILEKSQRFAALRTFAGGADGIR
jgi:acetolactate synthase-1/2/3 large subunit